MVSVKLSKSNESAAEQKMSEVNFGFYEHVEVSTRFIKMATSSFRAALAPRPPVEVVGWFYAIATAKSQHIHDIVMFSGRQQTKKA